MLSELNLMELNELYSLVLNNLHKTQDDADHFGGWYVEKLPMAEKLVKLVHNELSNRVVEVI